MSKRIASQSSQNRGINEVLKEGLKTNGHIHSPWSFSAFDNMEQMFKLASEENVKVLGINDFNTTDGYEEFNKYAMKYRIFPLFNIEFMGILADEQANGIRVNDTNNPGRMYFSGKGLRYPAKINDRILQSIVDESHKQIKKMIDKLNGFLLKIESDIGLDFNEIRGKWAENLVRERHIAKALRIKIIEKYKTVKERKVFLKKLFKEEVPLSKVEDAPVLENMIRAGLLKKGGIAYVKENEEAFPEIEKIIRIIVDAGGIPCYPVLLDDKEGNKTEFESDPVKLMNALKELNVPAIELIPGRNDLDKLKEFVLFYDKAGFVITLGTEHNTPAMEPLTVSCRGGKVPGRKLTSISYRGASVIAAHQHLHAKGKEGYFRIDGTVRTDEKEYFEQLGDAVIRKFIS